MKKTILMKIGKSIVLVSSLLTLLGCAHETKPSNQSLKDTHWTLSRINNNAVTLKNQPSLNFSGKKVNGFTGCNRFFTEYSTNEANVSFNGIGSTRKYCSGSSIMKTETQYLNALRQVKNYKITSTHLTLSDGTGNVSLQFIGK